MVDNMNAEEPIAPPPAPKPKSAFVTFMTSSTGKLVAGGIVLFIALVVLGALAFFFLVNAGNPPDVAVVVPGGSEPATETVVPANPPQQPLDETFTFRNVFAPTVTPAEDPSTETAASTSTTSGSTSTPTSNGPQDTLILKSIRVESGVYIAKFEWNGVEYDAVEGDQIGTSPWKVVTINSDSVVMLYGDSQVTLEVGQGISDGSAGSTK